MDGMTRDGRTGGWEGEWMDGWMNRRTDGRADGYKVDLEMKAKGSELRSSSAK